MYLLAARLAVAILAGESLQADRLSDREKSLWSQLRPSIVTLVANGKISGVAALIDDSGYFVTHMSSVDGKTAFGKSAAGKDLNFSVVSRDNATELTLLKTSDWPSGSARAFRSVAPGATGMTSLLAVLPSGPIRAAYVTRNLRGVLNPSRRMVPLAEIRFETSPQLVGGALIFTENGDLVGTLNATLHRQDIQMAQGLQNNLANNLLNNNGGVVIQRGPAGPGEMTVAYTVGADIVQHTLDCFLTPSHEVEYAYLGVFCTNVDALGGGALIQKVTPGSPADKSGLRAGDVLLNINYSPVPDQLAFANVMLKQKIGQQIGILVRRGRSSPVFIEVTPGKAEN